MTDDIEYRTASTTLEVRHSQRIIDLIAVPYDEDDRGEHPRPLGRPSRSPRARSPGCTATSP